MKSKEIQQKVKELQAIIANHKHQMRSLEKELYQAVSDYQKALDNENLKEIRNSLS